MTVESRSFASALASRVSRRRVLEGAATLAATIIATACGANQGAENRATEEARVLRPTVGATAPSTGSGIATSVSATVAGTSGTAMAMAPPTAGASPGASPAAMSATAPSPTIAANATANNLRPSVAPGPTRTAVPAAAGPTPTALPAVGPGLLQAFDRDPNMKVQSPVDWESPTEALQPFITPARSFFVRSHYPFPVVRPDEWRLNISGLVDRPTTLTYEQLTRMPSRKLTAWIECAGDGRSRFTPMASGTRWLLGAVSNGEWTGVPLRDVMGMAGGRAGAMEVVCAGAGNSQWTRGLPMAKAMDPDTLLAWQLNGENLRVEQGAPVRLIVPGWIGVANVKWLTSLDVLDKPHDGFFNTVSYTFVDGDGKNLGQLTTQPVKSIVTSVSPEARLNRGMQMVTGKAWSGDGEITKVEVSTDGGRMWRDARITQQAGKWSWYAFEYAWDAPAGAATITSRATDGKGNVQPEIPPYNRNGYQYNGWWRVPVTVQ